MYMLQALTFVVLSGQRKCVGEGTRAVWSVIRNCNKRADWHNKLTAALFHSLLSPFLLITADEGSESYARLIGYWVWIIYVSFLVFHHVICPNFGFILNTVMEWGGSECRPRSYRPLLTFSSFRCLARSDLLSYAGHLWFKMNKAGTSSFLIQTKELEGWWSEFQSLSSFRVK